MGRKGKAITAVAALALGLIALAPAAAQADSSVSVTGGNTLQVLGDSYGNTIHESHETDPACPGGSPCYAVWSEGTVLIPSAPCISSDVHPGTGEYRVLCPPSGIARVVMFGQSGDDELYGDLGVPAEIHGGAGKDSISGTSLNDTLLGGSGNDKLIAGAGDDLLTGQAGNDGMNGGVGRDRCIGGPGRDTPRRCEQVRSVP
jgi:Ca2+-binding RTX toxin-like protein